MATTTHATPGQIGLTAIANKWKVPPWILYGVYGMETDFGRNVSTSSAGAIGYFQFIPSTARSYSYPLTNRPTSAQAVAQADAAAHYLHDLYQQHGSWDAALRAYSGGGYGYRDVQGKAGQVRSSPGVLQQILTFGDPQSIAKAIFGSGSGAAKGAGAASGAGASTGQAVQSGANAVAGAASSAADVASNVWGVLSNPQTWLRVFEFIVALAVGVLALRQLSSAGQGSSRVLGPRG